MKTTLSTIEIHPQHKMLTYSLFLLLGVTKIQTLISPCSHGILLLFYPTQKAKVPLKAVHSDSVKKHTRNCDQFVEFCQQLKQVYSHSWHNKHFSLHIRLTTTTRQNKDPRLHDIVEDSGLILLHLPVNTVVSRSVNSENRHTPILGTISISSLQIILVTIKTHMVIIDVLMYQ